MGSISSASIRNRITLPFRSPSLSRLRSIVSVLVRTISFISSSKESLGSRLFALLLINNSDTRSR